MSHQKNKWRQFFRCAIVLALSVVVVACNGQQTQSEPTLPPQLTPTAAAVELPATPTSKPTTVPTRLPVTVISAIVTATPAATTLLPTTIVAATPSASPITTLATPTNQQRAIQELENLTTGISAFAAPTEMFVGQPVVVTYRLGDGINVTQPTLEAGMASTEVPSVLRGTPRLSNSMRATLTGSNDAFRVESTRPNDDGVRLIVPDQPAEWSWYVTALKPGPDQKLTLQLTALVEIGGETFSNSPPAEVHEVLVNVDWMGQTGSFIGSNWGWFLLLVPFGLALAGSAWLLRRTQKRVSPVTKSSTRRNRTSTQRTVQTRTLPPTLSPTTDRYRSKPPADVSSQQAIAPASPEDVDNQRALLKAHRRTLNTYLRQQATFGSAFVPPAIEAGIEEARTGIRNAKDALRSWGEIVEDFPGDEEDEEDEQM